MKFLELRSTDIHVVPYIAFERRLLLAICLSEAYLLSSIHVSNAIVMLEDFRSSVSLATILIFLSISPTQPNVISKENEKGNAAIEMRRTRADAVGSVSCLQAVLVGGRELRRFN